MGTIAPALVSLEEYLHTTYRPDCDYIDGELEERNVGQKDHNTLQSRFWGWFHLQRSSLQLAAYVEWRVRVRPGRYRIPDVSVIKLPEPDEQILTTPPYIVIEILSPDDTLPRMQERVEDFLSMGVPNVWIVDSTSAQAWICTSDGFLRTTDGVLCTTDGSLTVPLSEIVNF